MMTASCIEVRRLDMRLTTGQNKETLRLTKTTDSPLTKPLKSRFTVRYLSLTEGQRTWEELGHGRNYQQSGETDADEAGREAASALGSEAGANCGGGDPAFCRARVWRGAGGRYCGAVRHCQGVGFPALQEQGRIVLRGLQESGAVVSEIYAGFGSGAGAGIFRGAAVLAGAHREHGAR